MNSHDDDKFLIQTDGSYKKYEQLSLGIDTVNYTTIKVV